MKHILGIISGIFLVISSGFAAEGIVGDWVTIDDTTHKPRALVRITDENGVISATIQKVYKEEGDTGICQKCPGEFQGKPVQGLRFVWGLKPSGSNQWDGGQILDPKNGKIYRCKMKLNPNANSLDVRGYIGISLLGRTQVWLRKQ